MFLLKRINVLSCPGLRARLFKSSCQDAVFKSSAVPAKAWCSANLQAATISSLNDPLGNLLTTSFDNLIYIWHNFHQKLQLLQVEYTSRNHRPITRFSLDVNHSKKETRVVLACRWNIHQVTPRPINTIERWFNQTDRARRVASIKCRICQWYPRLANKFLPLIV